MSALAIGLLLGAGVFCIFWSTWPQTERSAPARRASLADRVRDQLVQAGFDTISPGQLLAACMVVFVIDDPGGAHRDLLRSDGGVRAAGVGDHASPQTTGATS